MIVLSINMHLGLSYEDSVKPDTQVGGEFLPPTIQVPFYQPTAERYKILMEARPFPSDYVSPLVGDWGGGGGG